MTKTTTLSALLAITLLSGCSEFRDGIDDTAISMKNRTRALGSWAVSRGMYDGIEHRRHFGKGYRDGYFDVAMGGNGCQPTLPPREYWGSWYQTERGLAQVEAYFDGHEHGAMAGRDDGAAEFHSIPTSVEFRAPDQAEPAAAGAELRPVPNELEDGLVGQARP